MSTCELNNCLCCLSHSLDTVIDMKDQPLSNDFISSGQSNQLYPLKMNVCRQCFHCQLSHAVSPSVLFRNYKYVSGTSNTSLQFFKKNAEFLDNYKENKKGAILDIACNDGSQLDAFKELGWQTYGVDPAKNLFPISCKKGHTVICDFWSESAAQKLPLMDIIIAQNVFAHTQFVDEFLKNCSTIMSKSTSLFIQTSQKDMIINREFDTVYHEHISFFNTNSMNTLVSRNNMVLNRVIENPIHGNSYIFEIKLLKDDSIYNVDKFLMMERKTNLYNIISYRNFTPDINKSVSYIKDIINEKRHTHRIIGFGASAKGQVLLSYADITLDYIIDENPLKIGLMSPRLRIPIVDLDHFKNDSNNKLLIIILAWNFAPEIKEKINKVKGDKAIIFIEKYFPNVVLS